MEWHFNKSRWEPWSQPAAPMYLVMTLNPSMRPLREYLGSPLFTSLIIFTEGIGTWLFRTDEMKQLGQKMIDLLLSPRYRVEFETGREAAREEVLAKAQASLGAVGDQASSIEQLVERFDQMLDAFYGYYKFAAFIEPVQFQAQDLLTGFLDRWAQARAAETLDAALTQARGAASSLDPFGVKVDMGPITARTSDAASGMFTPTRPSVALELRESAHEILLALGGVLRSDPELKRRLRAEVKSNNSSRRSARAVIKAAAQPSRANTRLLRAIRRHVDSLSWTYSNYTGPAVVAPETILQRMFERPDFDLDAPAQTAAAELAELHTERESNIARRRGLLSQWPAHHQEVAYLMDTVGTLMIDERKRVVMSTIAVLDRLLAEIAERTSTNLADCRLLIPQELRAFVEAPKDYQERFPERREAFLVYQADFPVLDELIDDSVGPAAATSRTLRRPMDDPYIAEGRQVDDVLHRLSGRLDLLSDMTASTNRLTGETVYFDPKHPELEAKVRVIRDTKVEKLIPGEVLVAHSTTPDYMDAIIGASAILTEWGAATSHAAVTAKELKKPCIIGVGSVSQVLRTGQLIRIRFKEGSIEVL